MWKIWCSRNKCIFDGERENATQVALQAQNLYRVISHAYGVEGGSKNEPRPRLVAWLKPPIDWVCLNVDGSALSNPGPAGFGGLVRDDAGSFLKGFFGSIGVSDVLHAEVLGLLNGLLLCWEMRVPKIICYSDSLLVLKLVKDGNQDYHKFGNEISMIRSLLKKPWDIQLVHTLREGNQCADFLAKLGATGRDNLVILDSPPRNLEPLLLADARGDSFVRL